jgi:hypothetical protein
MTTMTMQELIKIFEDSILECTDDNTRLEAFDNILIKLQDCTDEDKYLASELLNSLDYSDDEIIDLMNNS